MHFEGSVRTEWLRHEGDDRRMKLLETFVFVDSNDFRWVANPGEVVDGASIPRVLWSVAGDPFIGDYRRATVLHDVACQRRERPSKDVHRMFYEAMRTDGVDDDTAKRFYTAVRLFGPKWEIDAAGRVMEMAPVAGVRAELTFVQLEQALDVVLDEG